MKQKFETIGHVIQMLGFLILGFTLTFLAYGNGEYGHGPIARIFELEGLIMAALLLPFTITGWIGFALFLSGGAIKLISERR